MKLFRRGLGIGVLVVLAILACAAVVVPTIAGAASYTITGRSMEPTLRLGTLIVVQPVDPADIELGDIITYQLHSGQAAVATHRVVGFEFGAGDRRFITQGDNNDNVRDAEAVRPEQLKGRYWYGIPLIGWVNWVLTGSVRAWVIPLATGALFTYGIWMIANEAIRRRARNHSPSSDATRHA